MDENFIILEEGSGEREKRENDTRYFYLARNLTKCNRVSCVSCYFSSTYNIIARWQRCRRIGVRSHERAGPIDLSRRESIVHVFRGVCGWRYGRVSNAFFVGVCRRDERRETTKMHGENLSGKTYENSEYTRNTSVKTTHGTRKVGFLLGKLTCQRGRSNLQPTIVGD